jgi:hypothetical protein
MKTGDPEPRMLSGGKRRALKSRGQSRLGDTRILKKSVPEERCLTFASFVSFCADFFAAFCESVRDEREMH